MKPRGQARTPGQATFQVLNLGLGKLGRGGGAGRGLRHAWIKPADGARAGGQPGAADQQVGGPEAVRQSDPPQHDRTRVGRLGAPGPRRCHFSDPDPPCVFPRPRARQPSGGSGHRRNAPARSLQNSYRQQVLASSGRPRCAREARHGGRSGVEPRTAHAPRSARRPRGS